MQPPYPAPVTEWHNDTYDAINPKRPELSQAGKTIVITGAGQGIGREIVDAYAQAGASTIHILGRTSRTLEETKALAEKTHPNLKVVVHVADLVDTLAVEQAARAIGSWDVPIAKAGYMPSPALIENSDPDEWWKTFEVWVSFSARPVKKLILALIDQYQRQLYSCSRISSKQEVRRNNRCLLQRLCVLAYWPSLPREKPIIFCIKDGNCSLLRISGCRASGFERFHFAARSCSYSSLRKG